MFLSILKFAKGFVLVRLSGYAPERFFNLCSNHDILIWNLVYTEDAYEFCISIDAFRELKPIVKKTKTKLVILKRYGFPFWMHRYRKRKLFFGGIVLFFVLLCILSQFIWNIEINGNSYITDETILAYLKEKQMSFGTQKRKIDASKLEEELRIAFDDIIWTSVKINGTKMTIDLQENIKNEEIKKPNDGKAYDLVAQKDGVIDEIITRQGTPFVAQKSVVKKGDVLVSGRLDIIGDDETVTGYQYCVSDADIIATTIYPYEDTFPLTYTKKIFTGNTKQTYALSCMNYYFTIPSFKKEFQYSDKYSMQKQFKVCSDFYLPLSLEINTNKEYIPKQLTYKKEEAKELANTHLLIYLEKLKEKDIQILQKNVMIELDEKNCRVSGDITVKEKIGIFVPTEVLPAPEQPENQEGIDAQ